MVGTTSMFGKVQLPTGYEEDQRKAVSKRKLAEKLLALGVEPRAMNSWTQLGGQLAQALAGKHLDKKATKLEGEAKQKMMSDYLSKRGSFQAARAAGASPEQLINQFGADPLLQNDLDPFRGAFESGLKEDQNIVNNGGRWDRKGGLVGTFEPNKPTDDVIRGPNGEWQINPVKMTRDLGAQGYPIGGPNGVQGAVTSMADPQMAGQPPQGASPQGMPPVMPPQGQPAAPPMPDLSQIPVELRPMVEQLLRQRQNQPPPGVTFTPIGGGQGPQAPATFP